MDEMDEMLQLPEVDDTTIVQSLVVVVVDTHLVVLGELVSEMVMLVPQTLGEPEGLDEQVQRMYEVEAVVAELDIIK